MHSIVAAKGKIVLACNVVMLPCTQIVHPLYVPGLHGGDSVRQVHQADKQGGDNPLQHQRPDHPEERLILPLMQDRRHEASIAYQNQNCHGSGDLLRFELICIVTENV